MKERIKAIRNAVGKSQTDFAKELSVSRSAICKMESGENYPSEQTIKLICSEFNVNEEWLLNGTEPMFVQPDTFSLDDFVKSKGATGLELEIVKTYFELDPEIRRTAMEHFKRRLAAAVAADPALIVPDSEEELEAQCPPVDAGNASGVDAG